MNASNNLNEATTTDNSAVFMSKLICASEEDYEDACDFSDTRDFDSNSNVSFDNY